MKRKEFWIWVLISSGVFALITALFFLLFEKSTYTKDSGWKGEARTNPFLAAKRLLLALGTEADCYPGFPESDGLPPEDGTLILASPQNAASDKRTERLLHWVGGGGHLVTVVQDFQAVGSWIDETEAPLNALAGRFGIDFWYEGPAGKTLEGTPPGFSEPLRVLFETPLQMGFFPEEGEIPQVGSESTTRFTFGDDEGIKAVGLDYGQGTVTFLTDAGFMTNTSIDKFDHARFLFSLAGSNRRSGPVWLIYGRDASSLGSILFREAGIVLLAFFVWLCFWLWRAIPRIGPLIPDPPPHRRRLMEHIEAGGNFIWRHRQGHRLLEVTRLAVRRHIATRYPEWTRLSKDKMYEAIRHKTSLPTWQIEAALDERATQEDRDDFTFQMAVLGEIRRAL